MTQQNVEIRSVKEHQHNYLHIRSFELRFKTYAGEWSAWLHREIVERKKAVAVVLYDPQRHQVVLIEQFRIGAYVPGGESPWILELVAGLIEPGEGRDEVARRETQEESGMQIDELVPIMTFWTSPGGSSEQLTLFCGRVDASQAGGIHGVIEEGEDIKVVVLDCEEAFAKVQTGEICNAIAIIGLQWLELNQSTIFCN